jgi:cobalamin 5''-phosphate synthase/cobalamin synthase
MIRRLGGAIQFLTVLPTGAGDVTLSDSAVFFPVAGAALGAAASGIYLALARGLPTPLSSLAALLFLVLATGGLHEDGLADVADAFRAGRPAARIHEILKDSRVGAFGAMALIFSILFRWQALAALGPHSTMALIVSETLPRAAFVVLAHIAKPVGSGLGRALGTGLSRTAALLALAQGVAIACLAGLLPALIVIAGTAAIILLARSYFHRRIGGVTGDCLGATGQVIECFCLLTFVWQRSI